MLKQTPFHLRTAPLVRAQTWRRWAGYQVASAYEPHPDREYAAIRNAAALIDVSPLLQVPDHRARRGAAARPHGHARRHQVRRRPGALHAVVRRRTAR